MTDFKEKIRAQVISIGRSDLSDEHRDVLRVLYNNWGAGSGKVTQANLAAMFPQIGGHKRHDRTHETTLRAVRQIIRDLRTEHLAPILSDRDGYWIPNNHEEAREYIERIELEIKARVKASFETYKAMKNSLGIESIYLEGQEKLLV